MPANDRLPRRRPTAAQRRQRRRHATARGPHQVGAARTSGRTNTPGQRWLAAASHPALLRLHALPGWVVPLATLVLLIAGLFAGGVIGFVCLAVVATFLGWLLALSWPALAPVGRLLRLATVLAIVAAAAFQLR